VSVLPPSARVVRLTFPSNLLHISNFTMDDYEQALRHSVADPPCALISEIHSTLIYNLRTVPFIRYSALTYLEHRRDLEPTISHEILGVELRTLINAFYELGNNWERAPLRHAEGRDGWEESLLGCLKDVSILYSLIHTQV
jgi:bromodomain adjacent to zinc finger domain protein 1A